MVKNILLFIFEVILLMAFICQPIEYVTSDCRLFYKHSSKLNLKFITTLRADKLYDQKCYNSPKAIRLAFQCLKHEQCYYYTIDKENNVCSLYSQGSSTYNTTNLQTYVLELTSTSVWMVIIL